VSVERKKEFIETKRMQLKVELARGHPVECLALPCHIVTGSSMCAYLHSNLPELNENLPCSQKYDRHAFNGIFSRITYVSRHQKG